jgi:sugar phosphate isomerase/epimerase
MDQVSRRSFFGATAGAVGMAATVGEFSKAQAQDASATAPDVPRMKVGLLTAPFGDEPIEKIAEFARQAQIDCIEVKMDMDGGPIDLNGFDAGKADAIKQMLAEKKVEISSLAFYGNPTEEGKQADVQAFLNKLIDAASLLNVKTVCTIAGFPAPKQTKINTIKKVLPGLFKPVLSHAADKGINIALENWFETNLQGLDTFECLFETIPDKNFGLNYDPSHLFHQQINHLLPVKMFGDRIFHTHAKDCFVDVAERARVGVYGKNWWRYVIPGYGQIDWGEYIGFLRYNRYIGVLSIEHEDATFEREAGFIAGARYLRQYC